jgi:hypothetical protein
MCFTDCSNLDTLKSFFMSVTVYRLPKFTIALAFVDSTEANKMIGSKKDSKTPTSKADFGNLLFLFIYIGEGLLFIAFPFLLRSSRIYKFLSLPFYATHSKYYSIAHNLSTNLSQVSLSKRRFLVS